MNRLSITVALTLLTMLASHGVAKADSEGWVKGKIQFYQNQGNFCPTTRDCTSANYLQSAFNTYQPARHTRVYLRNDDDAIIGQGVTDMNGEFLIHWFSLTTIVNAHLTWHFEHKDNRFAVRTEGGGTWVAWTWPFWLSPTTASNPTDLGSYSWGSSTNPHQLANVYDGAWRTWYYGLDWSNRMRSYFNDVQVRAFDSNGSCPTSCASGPNNRIELDPNSAFMPQARIMHEMGHIASQRSHKSQSFTWGGNYCWPTTTGSCGWSMTSAEWAAASFEEGLATFFGDRAIYFMGNTEPHTCIVSAAACPNNSFDVEASTGTSSSCASNENRRAVTIVRFLRDIYDSSNGGESWDTRNEQYYTFFDTLFYYEEGQDNREEDEPWCGTTLCDLDGRSGRDFRMNYWYNYGLSVYNQWNNNCGPAGD